MTVASQLIMVPGDAPDVVPVGRRTVFLDASGTLCKLSPDGTMETLRVASASPGAYSRDYLWYAGDGQAPAPGGTLLPRYAIIPPSIVDLCIASSGYRIVPESVMLDLSLPATWDNQGTDYTVAANRAGRDFYVYACIVDGSPKYVVSANSTQPTGNTQYSSATTRKVGGFHCLCTSVGVISGHPLSGYVAGDILPAGVWDLKHRPVCAPEGMVYVAGINRWVDIYLASVSGGMLVSANGGTIADGTSSPAFHWCKFSQWLGAIGKRLPTQHEFVALSLGANQGTNIAGTADPVTTAGHTDTAGRRMISNVGCGDVCGVMWQWGIEPGGGASAASWAAAYDANDSGVLGQSYQVPNRGLLGGAWGDGSVCGSRASRWAYGPMALYPSCAARGVSEPLA